MYRGHAQHVTKGLRWKEVAEVSNLPFHVASQALFTLADHADGVRNAHVILQQEAQESRGTASGRGGTALGGQTQ